MAVLLRKNESFSVSKLFGLKTFSIMGKRVIQADDRPCSAHFERFSRFLCKILLCTASKKKMKIQKKLAILEPIQRWTDQDDPFHPGPRLL